MLIRLTHLNLFFHNLQQLYYIFTQINSQRAFDVLSAEIKHNEKFNLFNIVCNDKHYNHIYNDLNYRKIAFIIFIKDELDRLSKEIEIWKSVFSKQKNIQNF